MDQGCGNCNYSFKDIHVDPCSGCHPYPGGMTHWRKPIVKRKKYKKKELK